MPFVFVAVRLKEGVAFRLLSPLLVTYGFVDLVVHTKGARHREVIFHRLVSMGAWIRGFSNPFTRVCGERPPNFHLGIVYVTVGAV